MLPAPFSLVSFRARTCRALRLSVPARAFSEVPLPSVPSLIDPNFSSEPHLIPHPKMTSLLGNVTPRKLAALAAACTLALSVNAQTTWIGNTSTDFNAAANWSSGVPTASLSSILTTAGSSGSSLSITADIQVGGGTAPSSNATLFNGDAFTLTGNTGTRLFTIGGQGLAFNTTNTITFDVARIRRNASNTFEFLGSSANVVINSAFSTNVTAAADTVTRVDFTGTGGNNNTITFNGDITKSFGTAGSGAGLLTISSVGTGNRVVFNNAANTGFTGAVSVGNNAILQLGDGGTKGTLSGVSSISLGNTISRFIINQSDTVTQGTDFASTISGSGGLTQAGSGNLILAAGNTYTGTTTVSAGTLSLGATNSLADTSNVILSGGTLATNSFADTVGTLSLLGNATIDFTSGGSFAFANSAAATWTGGMTLSLTSGFVSGSSLRFGLDATGLTGTQLGQISAAGFDSFSLNSSGFLVGAATIPEPSTYAALAGLGALGLAVLRRRRAAQNNLNR